MTRFVVKPCVRCHREVSHRTTTWDPVPTPVRHKADARRWCSGQPKPSLEIVGEILASLDAERKLLGELTDSWVAQRETLVRISDEAIELRATTIDLLRQGGEAVRAELAALDKHKRKS